MKPETHVRGGAEAMRSAQPEFPDRLRARKHTLFAARAKVYLGLRKKSQRVAR
jgi:hypothetical protein